MTARRHPHPNPLPSRERKRNMWGSSIEGEGRKRKGVIKGLCPLIVVVMDFAVNYIIELSIS